MRILLCVHHALDPDSGAPGATLALGDALARLGHEISYLSFDDMPERLPALAKEALFPEFVAGALLRGGRDVDVVDASTGDTWLFARLAARRERPRLIARSHGLEHRFWDAHAAELRRSGDEPRMRSRAYHGGWRLREVAASLRRADACVFLNRDDRDYAIERLGVSGARAHVVANGLREAFLGRELGVASDAPDVGVAHVGSWAERKGSRYLSAAMSEVLEKDDRVRFTLAGTRCPPDAVTAAFPAPLRPRIAVVPDYRRDELPQILEGHQIAVSASLAEGFSLALPEVMACGLAPVATDISGAREIVTHGQNGLLAPTGDAGALATGVAELISDRRRLDELRRAALATAQQYSWTRVARDNLAVYESALAHHA